MSKTFLTTIIFFFIVVLVLCADGYSGSFRVGKQKPKEPTKQSPPTPPEKNKEQLPPPTKNREALPRGTLSVDITSVIGEHLPARIDLFSFDDGSITTIDVATGALGVEEPVGAYRAYVHVYDEEVPVMVEVKDIEVKQGQTTYLLVTLLEGSGGLLPIRGFDSDGDLAIDRVEKAVGTDPYNAGSIPGRIERFYDTKVLKNATQWYAGELHAYSNYGAGTEEVAALVLRAEKATLDFLAITDRNTLAAADDPGFRSDKLVLLPAMEWGTDAMGVALIYGPRTLPDPPAGIPAAQAECIRVQAQGGAWIIAHPAFPTKPWQWGLSFVNGVEVWFRGWREVPPMSLDQLGENAKERKDGRLIHSIAAAVAAVSFGDMSANGQSNLFYDYELVRGLMAGIIGGSGSGSPKVPIGRPVTYIHARELSVPGLLEGLRLGRTYVSSGLDGPKVAFAADVLSDNYLDVGIGGVIPLNVEVSFEVVVQNAVGMKLQVIENGRPIRTIPINAKDTGIRFKRVPTTETAYRVRVIKPADPKSKGFGPIEVHAITGPIYARDITAELLWRNPNFDPDKSWIRIQKKDITDIDMDIQLPEDNPKPLRPL